MKKFVIGSVLLLSASASALTAQADDVSVTATIDYTTDYVFRGVSLAESAIQPGVEVAIGDFYVGSWFSAGFGETSQFFGDEVDIYAGYGLSLSDTLGLDVGLTYYHYPQGGDFLSTDDGNAGSYEVYGGLSLDTVLSPSVYAYYDFTFEAFTLEGGLGHSLSLSDDVSLDLGLTAGLVDGDGFSWEYGQLSASLGYAFTEDVSAYVGANFVANTEDLLIKDTEILTDVNGVEFLDGTATDSKFFVGAGVSAGF